MLNREIVGVFAVHLRFIGGLGNILFLEFALLLIGYVRVGLVLTFANESDTDPHEALTIVSQGPTV